MRKTFVYTIFFACVQLGIIYALSAMALFGIITENLPKELIYGALVTATGTLLTSIILGVKLRMRGLL